MTLTLRQRFSLRATAGYCIFTLAWFFLSDTVLPLFNSVETLNHLAAIKAVIFITVTASVLWFTLQHTPDSAEPDLSVSAPHQLISIRLLWGIALPILGAAIQWQFWSAFAPFAGLLVYPAVFMSAWLGGWLAGTLATTVGTGLGWYFFIAPKIIRSENAPPPLMAIGIFFVMGILMSLLIDWMRRAANRSGNSKFQALVEQSLAGIYIVQGEQFQYVNPEFAQIFGYDSPEALIKNADIKDLVMPHDWERVSQYLKQQQEGIKQDARYTAAGRRRNGSGVDLEVHGRRLKTQNGVVIIGLVLDISERRRAEAALLEQQNLLDRMSALAKVGGWGLDTDTLQGTRTLGATHILDLDPTLPESATLQDSLRFFHGEHLETIAKARQRTIDTGEPYCLELEMISAKGVRKWIRTQGEPVWQDGRVVRVEGAIQDISEVHQARQALHAHREQLEDTVQQRTAELEAARQEAERLSRVKSDFLANMSHEIRTPLNGVLGLAQVGFRDHTGSAQRLFGHILESGRLLLGIINDILDFSKIEAGKLHIEHVPVQLQELLNRSSTLVMNQAQAKGLEVQIHLCSTLPTMVMSDPLRLEQILGNLLGNAAKFTHKGEVRLSATQEEGQLVFTVSDTGIGMNPRQIQDLYQPFEQGDRSTTRRYGGTGLGLSITKRLVELLNGTIHVQSEPGQGTRFDVKLPLNPC